MARPAKYLCNEHYFDNIMTPNQAYILGFIWADGSVSPRGGLAIAIKDSDRAILEFIAKELETDIPIRPFKNKAVETKYCRLSVNRQTLTNGLVKLGLGKNKSQNNAPIPSIDKTLIPHFLRELFDGDGSIWFNTGFRACFTGGYNFLLWLKDILAEFNIKCPAITFRRKGNFNGCSLYVGNRGNIEKLNALMYTNSQFHLDRKHAIFERAKAQYNKSDMENWKLNGIGTEILFLMTQGFYAKKISKLLNLNYNSVRRIYAILKADLCGNKLEILLQQ